jgi:hypothetical protein
MNFELFKRFRVKAELTELCSHSLIATLIVNPPGIHFGQEVIHGELQYLHYDLVDMNKLSPRIQEVLSESPSLDTKSNSSVQFFFYKSCRRRSVQFFSTPWIELSPRVSSTLKCPRAPPHHSGDLLSHPIAGAPPRRWKSESLPQPSPLFGEVQPPATILRISLSLSPPSTPPCYKKPR